MMRYGRCFNILTHQYLDNQENILNRIRAIDVFKIIFVRLHKSSIFFNSVISCLKKKM